MRPALLLVPPSEAMAPDGDGPGWAPASGRFAPLGPERATVAAALAEAVTGPAEQVAGLLGVRGRHLERAVAADRATVGAPTLPAGQRYRGVVASPTTGGRSTQGPAPSTGPPRAPPWRSTSAPDPRRPPHGRDAAGSQASHR